MRILDPLEAVIIDHFEQTFDLKIEPTTLYHESMWLVSCNTLPKRLGFSVDIDDANFGICLHCSAFKDAWRNQCCIDMADPTSLEFLTKFMEDVLTLCKLKLGQP